MFGSYVHQQASSLRPVQAMVSRPLRDVPRPFSNGCRYGYSTAVPVSGSLARRAGNASPHLREAEADAHTEAGRALRSQTEGELLAPHWRVSANGNDLRDV